MPAPVLKKIPGSLVTHKYLWIRIALLEKVLDKIVDYLVANADHYYSPESLIGDRTDGSGQLIASLLGKLIHSENRYLIFFNFL